MLVVQDCLIYFLIKIMEGLQELVSLMAHITPTKEMIKKLHEDCSNYLDVIELEEVSKEEKDKLKTKIDFSCLLVMEKKMIGESANIKDLERHLNKKEEASKMMDLANINKN